MNLRKAVRYLNPISRLGKRKYSYLFPLAGSVLIYILLETVNKFLLKDPNQGSILIIFTSIISIVYFSFHTGIRGGLISTITTAIYYYYIIYSRNYVGKQYDNSVESIITLTLLYLFIGSLIGWLKVTIDKLIENEADGRRRLQTIIQQLPLGIIIADASGRVTQQNKKLEEIIGKRLPENFMVGKDIMTYGDNPPPTKPQNAPLALALSHGKFTKSKEFEIEKNGKKVYVQVNASPIRSRDGRILAAVSVIGDITAEKNNEKRKDDFINIASHELKTPITSMKLYVDALLGRMKKTENKEAVRTLENIKYQTERLQELVSDLLDVSKINTGKLSFKKEKFKLNDLISETLTELQATTTQHYLMFDNKKSIYVYADKFRIYQVITNLITNAIKYSPNSSDIIISLSKKNGKIITSVRDFGIGINKTESKKIFDRLYRTADEEKTFPGFGMGLYISKEIIKRHSGKIWVESLPGKGSTFYFSLPDLKEEKKNE